MVRLTFDYRKLARKLDNIIYQLNLQMGQISSLALLCLAGFIFVNVVTRLLGTSIPMLFSISIYTLVIFVFFSCGFTLGEGRHVTVDVFTSRLPKDSRTSLEVLGYVFCLAFFLLLFWQSIIWTHNTFVMQLEPGVIFSTLPLLLWIIVLPMPIGVFFVILQLLRLIIKKAHFLITEATNLKACLMLPLLVILFFAIGVFFAFYVNPIVGLFISLLVLFFGGTPVAFSMAFVGCLGLYIFAGGSWALPQIPMTSFGVVESYPMAALPLFVLIGTVLSRSGLAKTLFSFTEAWFGRVPGSLLLVTIITGAIVCAITGSSVAATAMITLVCLPPLLTRRYDRKLSCGAVAAASVGSLIPPSTSLIIYGIVVEDSVGRLFMAALPISLITFLMFGLYIFLVRPINKEKFGEIPPITPMNMKFSILLKSFPVLLMPILILGGIYFGIFTATEAAGVAVIYGLFVVFVIKKIGILKSMMEAFKDALCVSSMTLWILVGGMLFATVVSQLKITQIVISFAEQIQASQALVVLIIFVSILIMGMFMSAVAVMLITLPVFYPLAMAVGIDSLWLGVFYTICVEIALLTPPIGVNLFVIQGASRVPFMDIVRGVMPFLVILSLAVLMIYLFPQIVAWLPSRMGLIDI